MPGMFEAYEIEEVFPAPTEARYASLDDALDAAAPYLLRLMRAGMAQAPRDENEVVTAQDEPA